MGGQIPVKVPGETVPYGATGRAAQTHPTSGDGSETKLRPQRSAERVERLGAERLVW